MPFPGCNLSSDRELSDPPAFLLLLLPPLVLPVLPPTGLSALVRFFAPSDPVGDERFFFALPVSACACLGGVEGVASAFGACAAVAILVKDARPSSGTLWPGKVVVVVLLLARNRCLNASSFSPDSVRTLDHPLDADMVFRPHRHTAVAYQRHDVRLQSLTRKQQHMRTQALGESKRCFISSLQIVPSSPRDPTCERKTSCEPGVSIPECTSCCRRTPDIPSLVLAPKMWPGYVVSRLCNSKKKKKKNKAKRKQTWTDSNCRRRSTLTQQQQEEKKLNETKKKSFPCLLVLDEGEKKRVSTTVTGIDHLPA